MVPAIRRQQENAMLDPKKNIDNNSHSVIRCNAYDVQKEQGNERYQNVAHFVPTKAGNVWFDKSYRRGTFLPSDLQAAVASTPGLLLDTSLVSQIQGQIHNESARSNTSIYQSISFQSCCIQYETSLYLLLCSVSRTVTRARGSRRQREVRMVSMLENALDSRFSSMTSYLNKRSQLFAKSGCPGVFV